MPQSQGPVPQLTLEPDPAQPSFQFPDPPRAPEPPAAEPAAPQAEAGPAAGPQQYGQYRYNGSQPQQPYSQSYQPPNYTAQSYQPSQPQQPKYTTPPAGYQQKSRMAAGLLAILVGCLGIHNFYMGFNTRGTIQLVLCLAGGVITCGLGALAAVVWGFIEGVMLLSSNGPQFDGNGVIMKD